MSEKISEKIRKAAVFSLDAVPVNLDTTPSDPPSCENTAGLLNPASLVNPAGLVSSGRSSSPGMLSTPKSAVTSESPSMPTGILKQPGDPKNPEERKSRRKTESIRFRKHHKLVESLAYLETLEKTSVLQPSESPTQTPTPTPTPTTTEKKINPYSLTFEINCKYIEPETMKNFLIVHGVPKDFNGYVTNVKTKYKIYLEGDTSKMKQMHELILTANHFVRGRGDVKFRKAKVLKRSDYNEFQFLLNSLD